MMLLYGGSDGVEWQDVASIVSISGGIEHEEGTWKLKCSYENEAALRKLDGVIGYFAVRVENGETYEVIGGLKLYIEPTLRDEVADPCVVIRWCTRPRSKEDV